MNFVYIMRFVIKLSVIVSSAISPTRFFVFLLLKTMVDLE